MAETYFFQGPCKWAKVYKPDTKFKPGHYSIDVYLDDDAVKEYKKIGLRNKVKEDEDGKFVSFRRKLGKWPDGNEIGPPEVVDKDNNKFDKLIGNLSEVAIEVRVYDAGDFGKGSRLNKVVVVKHVAYEKKEAEASGEAEDEAPKAVGKAKPKGLPF